MYLKFINVIIIVLLSKGLALSQDMDTIICSSSGYEFYINGVNYYEEGRFNKAYVCPKDLPSWITVVDAGTQTAINELVNWSDNLDDIPAISSAEILIFENDKLKIKCTFVGQDTIREADPDFLQDVLMNYTLDYHYNDDKNIMSYDNEGAKNLFRMYQWKIIHDEMFRNSLK